MLILDKINRIFIIYNIFYIYITKIKMYIEENKINTNNSLEEKDDKSASGQDTEDN